MEVTSSPADKEAKKAKGLSKKEVATSASLGSKIDPVSQNKIWREHCVKENSKLKLTTEFHFNPSTLAYIAEKPNKYRPSAEVSREEIEEAERFLAQVCISGSGISDLAPAEKYEVPQTSSQEYGWCSHPLVEPDQLFDFPHTSCEETKFAKRYQECMHKSPYARKDDFVANKGTTAKKDYANVGVNTSRVSTPAHSNNNVTNDGQASSPATTLPPKQ